MTDKNLKKLVFFLLILFYGILICCQIELPAMDDLPRHIKNGELILHGHWEVLYKNVYSYTLPDQKFVNHHWLSGVLYYFLYKVMSWSGLVIFKMIIMLCAFALLFRTALRKGNFWLVAIFSIPVIILLSDRAMLRPESFTALFVILFLYLLTYFDEHSDSKKIYWLIPVQILWVNLHLFFFIGPVLIAGWLLEKIVLHLTKKGPDDKAQTLKLPGSVRTLAILLLASIAVCFLNPNGLQGVLYPFAQLFHKTGFEVMENHSILYFLRQEPWSVNFPILIFIVSIALLAASFFISTDKRPKIFYFMACAAAVAAGIMVERLIFVFGILFLPSITNNLDDLFSRILRFIRTRLDAISPVMYRLSRTIAALFVMLILIVITISHLSGKLLPNELRGIGITEHSNDAAGFFKQNNLKGPIFNDFDIGSYLIWHFYPQEKVFADNRPEAYSDSFFNNTYNSVFTDEVNWNLNLEKYKFNSIILYQYDKSPGVREFISRRVQDTAWAFVYADQYAAIFVKNTLENQKVIKQYRITRENIVERIFYLLGSDKPNDVAVAGDLLYQAGYPDKGMETYFKIVDRWPQRARVWMIMAQAELNYPDVKSPLLAIVYLKNAINAGWNSAEAYSLLGQAYLKIGFNEQAEAVLRKALNIDPDRADAQHVLKEMGKEVD